MKNRMDNSEETTEIIRPEAVASSRFLESPIPAEARTVTTAMAATAVEVRGLSYTFPDADGGSSGRQLLSGGKRESGYYRSERSRKIDAIASPYRAAQGARPR